MDISPKKFQYFFPNIFISFYPVLNVHFPRHLSHNVPGISAHITSYFVGNFPGICKAFFPSFNRFFPGGSNSFSSYPFGLLLDSSSVRPKCLFGILPGIKIAFYPYFR